MKKLLLIALMLVLFTTCKEDEEDDQGQVDYNVTVIQEGTNCGDSYLIKFDEDVTDLIGNTEDFVYNEINLADEFKVDNLRLKVNFREPEEDERISCIDFGTQYPQVFILSAIK